MPNIKAAVDRSMFWPKVDFPFLFTFFLYISYVIILVVYQVDFSFLVNTIELSVLFYSFYI